MGSIIDPSQLYIFQAIGIAIFHSLWMGTLVLLLFGGIYKIIPGKRAKLRYILSYSGLFLIFLAFLLPIFLIQVHQKQNMHVLASSSPGNMEFIVDAQQDLGNTKPIAWNPLPVENILEAIEPWLPAMAAIWFLGFIFYSFRLLAGIFVMGVGMKKGCILPGTKLLRAIGNIQNKLNIQGNLSIRTTLGNISPMVVGIVKPVILIPLSAVSELSVSQLELILMHELEHIKRKDPVFRVLQAIFTVFVFYHPAAWIFNDWINKERENACDDAVMKYANDPITYIKTLTMMQEIHNSNARLASALTGKHDGILARAKRIVFTECTVSLKKKTSILIALFLMGGIAVSSVLWAESSLKMKVDSGIAPNPSEDKTLSALIISSEMFSEKTSISKDKNIPDTSSYVILNGTVNTKILDKKENNEKELKIVFERDSVKEIYVDGEKIANVEEARKYDELVAKIRDGMNDSRKELELAEREMGKASEEMDRAREEFQRSQEEHSAQLSDEIMREIQSAMEDARKRMEEYRCQHGDEIREQMERAKEQMKMAKEQFTEQDLEKIRQEMEKVREEIQKAMEQFHMDHPSDFNLVFPPLEHPIPMPEISNQNHEKKSTEQLESELDDLEKKN